MSAAAQTVPDMHQAALADIEDFRLCCADHAFFCDLGVLALSVAADNLQWLAERWGLVDLHGQDEIQTLMASAFAPPEKIDLPSDYGSQIVRQWELADERDRWKHTSELPPAVATIEPSLSPNRAYQTVQTTIDAFLHVARTESAEYLAEWLGQHPVDAPYLHNLWKARCSTAPAI
jgi:hypothetical protein